MKIVITTLLLLVSGIVAAQSDTALIRKHLEKLTLTDKYRNYEFPEQLNKTADYIKKEFEKYADTVYYQVYKVHDATYKNVIAVFAPDKPKTVVVGAHYDVCGNQQGADDNASGVTGLLELARIFDTLTFEDRMELVAYTLEEPPFFRTDYMGSYVHAKSLVDEKRDVKGMIVLEMIGYFSDEKKSQEYPLGLLKLFYGGKGNYITVVNKFSKGKFAKRFLKGMKLSNKKSDQSNIDVKAFTGPKNLTGIDFSDHLNYWKFGFSACMVTDTSFYRNKNYHQKTDKMGTLNIPRMAMVIDAVVESLVNSK